MQKDLAFSKQYNSKGIGCYASVARTSLKFLVLECYLQWSPFRIHVGSQSKIQRIRKLAHQSFLTKPYR